MKLIFLQKFKKLIFSEKKYWHQEQENTIAVPI